MAEPFTQSLPDIGAKPWTLNPVITEMRGRISDTDDIISTGRLSEEGLQDAITAAAAELDPEALSDSFIGLQLETPGSDSNSAATGLIDTALTPVYVPVTNPAGLNRAKRELAQAPHRVVPINYVSDSNAWGVGSDGLPGNDIDDTTSSRRQQDSYKKFAIPVILSGLLNGWAGTQQATGFAGLPYNGGGKWAYGTASSGVVQSPNVGPFGNDSGAERGGVQIPVGEYVEFNDLGPFSRISVKWFGSDSVSLGREPTIIVDGVIQHLAQNGVMAGGYRHTLITGLDPTEHLVRIVNNSGGNGLYVARVDVSFDNGVIVNRVGSPGATSRDVIAASTTAQRDRIIEATFEQGHAPLTIMSVLTNDGGQTPQISPSETASNTLTSVTPLLEAGGSVLLHNGPPRNAPTGAYTEADYVAAYRNLAATTPNVTFVDVRAWIGDRATGVSTGTYATSTTVHLSRIGAASVANLLFQVITQPMVFSTTQGLNVAPKPVNSATVRRTSDAAILSWSPIVGATRYQVERRVSPGAWGILGSTAEGEWTDTTAVGSDIYEYRVTASNQQGTAAVSQTAYAPPGAAVAVTFDFTALPGGSIPSSLSVSDSGTGTSTAAIVSSALKFTFVETGRYALVTYNGVGTSRTVESTVSNLGASHLGGVFVGKDRSNYVAVLFYTVSGSDFHYRLVKRVSGLQTTLATHASLTSTNGDAVTLQVSATGAVTATLNGSSLFNNSVADAFVTDASLYGVIAPGPAGTDVSYSSLEIV